MKVMAEFMGWSTERPTEPGWYWWKADVNTEDWKAKRIHVDHNGTPVQDVNEGGLWKPTTPASTFTVEIDESGGSLGNSKEKVMTSYVDDLLDEVDAALFSGDSFHNKPALKNFCEHLDRWKRRVGDIMDDVLDQEKDQER